MAAQSRKRTSKEIDSSFWAMVRRERGPLDSDCWVWTGARRTDGYGVRTIRCRVVSCHRWAYERWIGPIPKGMFCCHQCDNRGCANPHHIFLGDWKANARDASSKGRLRSGEKWRDACRLRAPHGENHCCAKLTEAEARYIRASMGLKTQMQVVREMGLSRTIVRGVWEGKTWKHIR